MIKSTKQFTRRVLVTRKLVNDIKRMNHVGLTARHIMKHTGISESTYQRLKRSNFNYLNYKKLIKVNVNKPDENAVIQKEDGVWKLVRGQSPEQEKKIEKKIDVNTANEIVERLTRTIETKLWVLDSVMQSDAIKTREEVRKINPTLFRIERKQASLRDYYIKGVFSGVLLTLVIYFINSWL